MPVIDVRELCKTYRTAVKEPGFGATLRHFVRRSYKEVHAVKNVSLSIEPGEFVGFLGANGAGKTTTLKILTGLINPSSGHVAVCGATPFERRNDFLRRITLVMGQKQQLIWDLPALDSIQINAAVYEIPENEVPKRIDALAELLDIKDQLKVPVRKLSLGERMKCELLAALLHEPEVLFLDEPTLGLDVNAQEAIRGFLKRYNEERKATVLLTSHYMADIVALCPRVIVMHEGSLIYDGQLSEIVDRFAPYREIQLKLARVIERDELAQFGEIASLEGRDARLLVRRDDVMRTVQEVLSRLAPEDLSVKDPPVEQIVGRIFQRGQASSE